MIVKLGNPSPREFVDGKFVDLPGPAVTTISVDPYTNEEGNLHPGYIVGTDVTSILRKMAQNPGPMKPGMGGNELIIDIFGEWSKHSNGAPSFFAVVEGAPYPEDVVEDLVRFVCEYWECPAGVPGDLEATHYTQDGSTVFAPGESPEGV